MKPGHLCNCGNCEDAVYRALGIVQKMVADEECTIYAVAVGIAMAAIASDVMRAQMQGIHEDGKMPPIMAGVFAVLDMEQSCQAISHQIKDWYEKNSDARIVPILNEVIERANKAHEEEKNLPKGD